MKRIKIWEAKFGPGEIGIVKVEAEDCRTAAENGTAVFNMGRQKTYQPSDCQQVRIIEEIWIKDSVTEY